MINKHLDLMMSIVREDNKKIYATVGQRVVGTVTVVNSAETAVGLSDRRDDELSVLDRREEVSP